MEIAVLTFDAFNEMDSFVSATLLNRLSARGWHAYITAPTERVTSRNGIVVEAQRPLEFCAEADAVIFGSGMRTDAVATDPAMLARMDVDPQRQLLVGQCSGALIMAALCLLDGVPACTDLMTRPLLETRGQRILDQPFHAAGNVATNISPPGSSAENSVSTRQRRSSATLHPSSSRMTTSLAPSQRSVPFCQRQWSPRAWPRGPGGARPSPSASLRKRVSDATRRSTGVT